MNFPGLIFLLIAHFLTGSGVLRLFKVQLEQVPAICFSFIVGVPLLSFAPCLLQLMGMPITDTYVFWAVAILTALFSLPLLKNIKRPQFQKFVIPKLYEWPFLAVVIYFIIISLWRCYFMPPYSRDMLSGPELIAEYAVREQTMINSVYNIDLSTSNNYFKSPYVTSLQIIYKLLVHPFGQLWLSILFLSFTIWIFTLLKSRVHPFLAGFLMVLFIAIPELFAYSFVILYDYSNMVFFFSGFYFLVRYLQTKQISDFGFSVLLFGLATYIRTESIILIGMMMPLLLYRLYKDKVPFKTVAMRVALFLFVPFVFYFVCINVFVHQFVPIPLDVSSSLNENLGDISYLTQRLADMASLLIFSYAGSEFYGYFIFIFCAILCIDLLLFRKFSREALFLLYGVAVIYFGLGFIGYLLPLADLSNTTKRGMFKAFPMTALYMANSSLVQWLSDYLKKWEISEKWILSKKEKNIATAKQKPLVKKSK